MGTLPKLYSLEDCRKLFAKHMFYAHNQNVVSEGQLVDIFGPIILPHLDYLRNYVYPHQKSTLPKIEVYGSDNNRGGTFRAVNFDAFCDVVSFINVKTIEDVYSTTYGGCVARVRFEIEQTAIAEEIAKNRALEEERHRLEVEKAQLMKQRRLEYYLKQKEKKAKEAAEG